MVPAYCMKCKRAFTSNLLSICIGLAKCPGCGKLSNLMAVRKPKMPVGRARRKRG